MKISVKDIFKACEEAECRYETYDKNICNIEYEQVFKNNDKFTLALGDNINFLSYMIKNEIKPKFIYMDPPFFSKADYFNNLDIDGKAMKILAYKDGVGQDFFDYLSYIYRVARKSKDVLADDGILAVHLDWHSVHYVKVILDEIFGYDNFVNEIIWSYKSGGASKKSFSKKHDTILIYSKSKKYTFNIIKEKSYNRGMKKYGFKGILEFEDEKGWYTLVNMKDVWNIDMVGRSSKSRTGYATQKPEQLLSNLIEAFTNKGDLVCDIFSGSGTTMKVAKNKSRKFVGCDINKYAMLIGLDRIGFEKATFLYEKDSNIFSDNIFDVEIDKEKVFIKSWNVKNIDIKLSKKFVDISEKAVFFKALKLNEEGFIIETSDDCNNIDLDERVESIILIDKLANMMKLRKDFNGEYRKEK